MPAQNFYSDQKIKKVFGVAKSFSKTMLFMLLDFYEAGYNLRRRAYRGDLFNLNGEYGESFKTCLRHLKRHGYIEIENKDGKTLYELTAKGEMEARKYQIKIKLKQQKWDGRWRLIIFDVPEQEKKLRNGFRKTLKFLGCKQLQQSVWVTPCDIFDYLEILVPDIKKHKWIKLIEANFIIGIDDVKRLFGL